MDFNQAAVFVKVVQAGGFSAAARQLGLPTSTVSNRVATLEKRLGVTLLQRTTRRLKLTEAGETYFRHASAGMEHLLDAETAVSVSGGVPKGLLRVTSPADLGDLVLANIVNRMRYEHPEVNVDLILTNQYVDLVAEGIDVAIRTGKLRDSTLIARNVGIARWAAFASPEFLATAAPINSPQDLRHHCCLQFTPLGKDAWTLFGEQGSVVVPMAGRVMANDLRVIRSLAVAGKGVAMLPVFLCREEGDNARLVRILAEWHARADPIHIVYPRQRFVPPKLRAFVDIAAHELGNHLDRQ